ncbi:MAG TPA: YafY family protein [Cytophagales bacterium]|nr:YafY family protein [Cytophagales bacterium]
MNRFDRITAILIQLQSKKVITAQEIADRFEVSLRTIYRDIRSLEEAGIPIVSEVGVGYSMMDGYRLPPGMFTKEEALTFITAEKLMERFTDYSLNKEYKSAMYKVRAVLRNTEKDYIEEVEDHIAVLPNANLPQQHSKVPLQAILHSISEKKVIQINYFSNHSQEQNLRLIEPVGVFHLGDNWHLIAYCQLRKDYRDFRMDRISQISTTEMPYHKSHPSLQSFLNKLTKEKEMQEVVIHVQRDIYRHIGDQKYYHGFMSQHFMEEVIEMAFLTSSIEGFARWYMIFGDKAEIIKPQSLKIKVKELTEKIMKKM